MENREETKLMQTSVYGIHGAFFVSTIHRHSSAAAAYDMKYYETFAWDMDSKTNERGKIVADNSGALTPEGAVRQHREVVDQLLATGVFSDKEEN